jgi:hypothetical protein
MRIAASVARVLLGLIFLVFGLNGFLLFLPLPPPTGVALLLGGYFCSSGNWWFSAAGKSLRIFGAGCSWTRDREYFFLSPFHGPRRPAAGDPGGDSVAAPGHPQQTAPGGNFRPARRLRPTLGANCEQKVGLIAVL